MCLPCLSPRPWFFYRAFEFLFWQLQFWVLAFLVLVELVDGFSMAASVLSFLSLASSTDRSGATTTRFSQPDPDSLKAFNQYVRKAKTDGKIKIAFTMCNRPALESVLKSLKHVVEITEDPVQCDLLIMDKGERTYKFLIAIASNKPVLSTNWLHSVKKTRTIEVKADHIFSDAKFEETMKFKPLSVLQHTRLLSGLHFMLGEDIIPKPIELKVIIQSAGGKVLTQPPSLAFSVELYVVTTSKDQKFHRRLRNHEKVHFIKTEGVMQALVRHNAELLNEHKAQSLNAIF
uniref:PAX-interacting protein 1 n=1 Tax=Drosophila rhopaloa TaxID=1041015 RepID=A0A6P4E101_DRORH